MPNLDNGTIYTFPDIIGEDQKFKRQINFAKKIAVNNSSVLILGSTGTGKELFAQSIHNHSKYKNGEFIAINCAAIPTNLIEGILFGTEEGVYTDAKENQGLLKMADKGTIFLDEINSMDLQSQAKLLRFLQTKTIRTLGGKSSETIDCRVISSVNKPIEDEIEEKNLRQDLYYRLATVTIDLPNLVDRKGDIQVLSKYFIQKANKNFNTQVEGLDDDLKDLLNSYSWPGNVRELEHVIESAMNMVIDDDEKLLKIDHLSDYLVNKLSKEEKIKIESDISEIFPDNMSLHDIMDYVEKEIIIDRLIKNQINISQTADQLDIFRQALQYRIKKYNIDVDKLI